SCQFATLPSSISQIPPAEAQSAGASEYAAEDLASDVLLARALIRHHPLGRGKNGHAEAVGDGRKIAHRLVDAAPRLRDALDIANRRLSVGVLELDLELGAAVLMVDARVSANITLIDEHVEHARA